LLLNSNSKIAIIGVGNILFCDDGIGVVTTEILKQCYRFSLPIDIIDGGTLGIGIINYFSSYDEIIILDTISLDDTVGSIYSFDSSQLLEFDGYKNTAHEVEVMDMLRSAMLLDKYAKVQIIGIVPNDINSVSIGLSEQLILHLEAYLKTILNQIEILGIKSSKIKQYNINDIFKYLTTIK